jgi:Na+/phosphate symporter
MINEIFPVNGSVLEQLKKMLLFVGTVLLVVFVDEEFHDLGRVLLGSVITLSL